MPVSLDFLVKILQLELKEVEYDLQGLKELYAARHDSSEITNYVFLENTALLQSELDSIHQIATELEKHKIEKNYTTAELLESVDTFVKKEIEDKQYSEAVYNFVKRKLTKVSKYLDM